MNRTVHEIHRYEDVRAALADPHLVPELPGGEGRVGASMGWLRASVPRFSAGEAHARRRALVESELTRLDPDRLRETSTHWPASATDDASRHVVHTLAEALGYPDPPTVAESVRTVASAYFGGESPEADAAVEHLVNLLRPAEREGGSAPTRTATPPTPDTPDPLELAAARICLLVQACDATAGLVRNAAAAEYDGRSVEQVLRDTVRHDPPVRALRRIAARDTRVGGVDIAAGDLVVLDATAEGDEPLAFGGPPRVCPGREHAMALTEGALAAREQPGARFARLHRQDTPFLLPNAWDAASAAALAAAGFEAIGTTSLGVAAAAGLPDGAGVTADATLALARRLGDTGLLFTVDMEGGFSDDPARVADLARQVSAAGAAGINLEDGRADGGLTPTELHAAKIRAVKAAAPGLFVNARTDTYWLGREQDDTEKRLTAYQQAGADGLFVPGLAEPERIRDIAGRFPLPLNILYAPTGPTLDELAALGVRRVSLGSLLYRRALGEAVATARAVREGRRPTGDTLTYGQVQAL
ncbi:isocitrate lyase/phosphoenolpyruvate mutase family protein [Streptomyces sp. NPDC006422]|uniref:isocitrate lyase/phosphoenolpyruvate mutase family protein n=1 Tax=unclassified Streptomyces TaxID=2593676 RepID=UPI0033A26488